MLRTIKPTNTLKPAASRSASGAGASAKAKKASRAAPVQAVDKADANDQPDGFEAGGRSSGFFAAQGEQAPGRMTMGPLAARMQGPQALNQTALHSFGQQLGAVAFANIMATLENPKAMKEAHRHYYEAIRTRLMHLAKLVRMNPSLKTPENA